MAPGYALPDDQRPQTHEPPWMATARSLIGQREIPGGLTAGFITTMLAGLHAWWKDDETPWCATFVSWCLQDAGLPYPQAFYRAKSFMDYGRPWADMRAQQGQPYGAIACLSREGGGHVAFYVGRVESDKAIVGSNYVYLLGGNQDNQVCVRAYHASRVLAYRWPTGVQVSNYAPSPLLLGQLIHNVPPSRSDA